MFYGPYKLIGWAIWSSFEHSLWKNIIEIYSIPSNQTTIDIIIALHWKQKVRTHEKTMKHLKVKLDNQLICTMGNSFLREDMQHFEYSVQQFR